MSDRQQEEMVAWENQHWRLYRVVQYEPDRTTRWFRLERVYGDNFVDYPIYVPRTGQVLYNWPEAVPVYVKRIVRNIITGAI